MCIRNATVVVDTAGELRIIGGDRCPLFRLCHESNLNIQMSCRQILAAVRGIVPTLEMFMTLVGATVMEEKAERPKFQHVCEYCGNEFFNNRKHQKFCCHKCAYTANNGKKKVTVEKVCLVCGRKFVTNYLRQKYCSQTCHYVAHLKNMREAVRNQRDTGVKRKPKWLKCRRCGKKFLGDFARQKYCSDECQRFADIEHAAKREKKGKRNEQVNQG